MDGRRRALLSVPFGYASLHCEQGTPIPLANDLQLFNFRWQSLFKFGWQWTDKYLGKCIEKGYKKEDNQLGYPLFVVRMARLELAQDNSHYPLKVARLPFRHIRLSDLFCFGIANVRLNFESANIF